MIAMETASRRHRAKERREFPQSIHHVLSSCQQLFTGYSTGCGQVFQYTPSHPTRTLQASLNLASLGRNCKFRLQGNSGLEVLGHLEYILQG